MKPEARANISPMGFEDHTFRELVQRLPNAVVIMARDGAVMEANSAARALGLDSDTFTDPVQTMIQLTDELGRFRQLQVHRLELRGDRVAMVMVDVTEERQLAQQVARARRAEALAKASTGLLRDLSTLLAPVCLAAELFVKHMNGKNPLGLVAAHLAQASALASKLLRDALEYVHGPTPTGTTVEPEQVIEEMMVLLQGLLGNRPFSVKVDSERPLTARVSRLTFERLLLSLIAAVREGAQHASEVSLRVFRAKVGVNEAPELQCAPLGSSIAISMSAPLLLNNGRDTLELALMSVRSLSYEHGWGISTRTDVEGADAVTIYMPAENVAEPS